MNVYFKSLIATALIFATFAPVTASPIVRHVGRQVDSGPGPMSIISSNGTVDMPPSAAPQSTTLAPINGTQASSIPVEPTSLGPVGSSPSLSSVLQSIPVEPTPVGSVGSSPSASSVPQSIPVAMPSVPSCPMLSMSSVIPTASMNTEVPIPSMNTEVPIPSMNTEAPTPSMNTEVPIPSMATGGDLSSSTSIPGVSTGACPPMISPSMMMPIPSGVSMGGSQSTALPTPTEVLGGSAGIPESMPSVTDVPEASTACPSMILDTTSAAMETSMAAITSSAMPGSSTASAV